MPSIADHRCHRWQTIGTPAVGTVSLGHPSRNKPQQAATSRNKPQQAATPEISRGPDTPPLHQSRSSRAQPIAVGLFRICHVSVTSPRSRLGHVFSVTSPRSRLGHVTSVTSRSRHIGHVSVTSLQSRLVCSLCWPPRHAALHQTACVCVCVCVCARARAAELLGLIKDFNRLVTPSPSA